MGCVAVALALLIAALVFGTSGRARMRVWQIRHRGADAAPAADGAWAPLTALGARQAEDQIVALGAGPTGPVFASLHPADFAAYMLLDVAGTLPPRADSARAAAAHGRLWIRTRADVAHAMPDGALGRGLALVGGRPSVELGGTIDVIRPGVAEFRVEALRIHDWPAPQVLIPAIIRRVEAGRHPADVAANGLLLNLPAYVADVRMTPGKVVLYKSTP